MPGLQREWHSAQGLPAYLRGCVRAWVRGHVHAGGGAWVGTCMRAGGGAHFTCILWGSVSVKVEMKASIWEVSMAAAYTTSKMITALRDAILESWRGT